MRLGAVCFILGLPHRIDGAVFCYRFTIESLGNDNFELLFLFYLLAFALRVCESHFYMSWICVAVNTHIRNK